MSKRGYYGIGIINGKTPQNIGTLFRSALVFGADFIFTVGKRYERQASDTTKSHKHIPLYNFATIDDLKKHLPFGCKLVAVELDNKSVPLDGYEHPERACYLLGAEDHGLTNETIKQCHDIIELPGNWCLNVSVAGSIVMYDRLIKTTA